MRTCLARASSFTLRKQAYDAVARAAGVREHPLFGFDCFLAILRILQVHGHDWQRVGRVYAPIAASWVNHGCRPNVRLDVRPGRLGGEPVLGLTALTDICAGDELLLSYVPLAALTRTSLLAQGIAQCACGSDGCVHDRPEIVHSQRKQEEKQTTSHPQAFRTARDFILASSRASS